MNRRDDLPGEVHELVGLLSDLEPHITENWDQCATGVGIVSAVATRGRFEGLTDRINVIPSRRKGACHDTLLVVIGGHESDVTIDNRILEAVEHIFVHCPKETKNVLFWAARWSSLVWSKHVRSFRGRTALLKPFLADPTRLET